MAKELSIKNWLLSGKLPLKNFVAVATICHCYFFASAAISTQGADNLPTDNVWTDLTNQPQSKRIRYAITNTCNTAPCVKWYHKSYPASYNLIPNVNVVDQSGVNLISFYPTNGSGCGNNQFQVNLTPPEREENYGSIVRNEKQFSEYENEFKQWEKELSYTALKDEGWHPLNSPDDTLYDNFINLLDQGNFGKLREVQLFAEQNDLIFAKSKNDGIAPENIMEENRKKVNEIYFKTFSVDKTELDSVQIGELQNIACQDPLSGGGAVYSARVMLRQEGICEIAARKSGESVVTESSISLENSFDLRIGRIYPNPNNGTMQLDYTLNKSEKAELIISDLAGHPVKEFQLLNENNSIIVTESDFQNGVYIYEIKINGEIAYKEKLIIIK